MIWKGGSSLMIILGEGASRLSIDIDILCPPGTDITRYLQGFEHFGFTDCTMIERQQRTTSLRAIPNFIMRWHLGTNASRKDQYHQVDERDILYPFFEIEGTPLKVRTPSINDILGDNLTAFAPNTCGIPYFKSRRNRSLDIIKQLFDISRLMDAATDIKVVREVFSRIAPIELAYREQPEDLAPVFDDIRQTALCISTRGLEGKGQFQLLHERSDLPYPVSKHLEPESTQVD